MLNDSSLVEVAVYILTGTLTSPNDIEPFHTAFIGSTWIEIIKPFSPRVLRFTTRIQQSIYQTMSMI